jgi:hypothetical protein
MTGPSTVAVTNHALGWTEGPTQAEACATILPFPNSTRYFDRVVGFFPRRAGTRLAVSNRPQVDNLPHN